MTIVEAIERVANRKSLKESEAREVMAQVMDGEATPSQIAALLVALRMKGETETEMVGFAREMRARVLPVKTKHSIIVDTCGTGGDCVKTFNLSTAAAIVASAAGAVIAKHGNRAVTSRCGSADVLEFLGVNLNLGPYEAGKLLDEIGLAFLFAPNYHPAMKHAATPRKEMKLRTVFNLLGPLTNPAGADRQLIGVFSPALVPKLGNVLKRLGAKRAVVAHGKIGIDEVSPIGSTCMVIYDGNRISDREMAATDFGIEPPSLAEIAAVESVEGNALKLRRALTDVHSPEARAVLPGAGVALWLAEKAESFSEGVKIASKAIESGKAHEKLERLIRYSNEFATQ
ncbi:MAG TPA: anthranilate phosphoribosyltransferase [Fimbriimonadales bacterium]|nr:anthranilate phosphoribosyltransferase [Fimbriimonadales bacterium]